MMLSPFCKYYLLLAFLLANSAHGINSRYDHHHHNYNSSNVVEVVVAVGIVAAVAYGFYKLCDWLFTKTDKQILDEGWQAYHAAFGATHHSIEKIKKDLGQFPGSRKEQQHIIKQVTEDFLYCLSIEKFHTHAHMYRDYEKSLRHVLAMVNDRIDLLRKESDLCSHLKDLQDLARALADLYTDLTFCKELFAEHATYFDLFDLEAHQMAIYEFELSSLDYHVNNPLYLREALRMAVMKKAAHERMSYPYMKFIDHLESDLKNLGSTLNRLAHGYHNRTICARQLLQRLEAVYNIVISEDAYTQELRDYKKEMLERERIAAEQTKAEAAVAQAHAAHIQAQAMQQQVHALQQQNQLQAQQNHILASQGPTRVNVYL